MNLSGLLDKLLAILRRDFLTAIRYRTGFMIGTIGALAEMTAFYYLARAIGPGFRPEGMEYYPFLLVGTGFYTFLIVGINSFLGTIQEAQQNGTLEVLMTTSTPAPVLVFLSAISSFGSKTLTLIFYVAAGLLLFRVSVPKFNPVGCLFVFLLSVGIAVAIGIFAGALQLATQKGSAVVWLLGSAVWFLTGALFPVHVLPSALRGLSMLIPITHSLEAMRLALLQGASLADLRAEILALMAFCGLLLPLSLVVFARVVRSARLNGTLSFY